MRSIAELIRKLYGLPLMALTIFWGITVYSIKSFIKIVSPECHDDLIIVPPLTLFLPFLYAIHKAYVQNKNDAHLFLSLSIWPLLFIGSYLTVLIGGDTLYGEGAWWLFYAIALIGIGISLVLFVIGIIVWILKS
jgi:hypothetical protein